MMDMLLLEGLELPCRVGCTPEERSAPQLLWVDLQLCCPTLRQAGERDDLTATVDYRIATEMIAAVQREEYLLIERVAEVLAGIALRHPRIDQVQVTVRKRPPVQGLAIAGVTITRGRA